MRKLKKNTGADTKVFEMFENSEFGTLTLLEKDNEPWFIGKEIADILGYSQTQAMTKLLDSDEKVNHPVRMSPTNVTQKTIINESGLYVAIFGSHMPKAKIFRKWVTSVVLPAIRKTGGYIIDKPEDTPEELMARALLVAQDTLKRKDSRIQKLSIENKKQKGKIRKDKPKVQYYNKVLDSKSCFTITQIAKQAEMTATHLNIVLEQENIQFKQSGQWLLKKEYQDKGLVSTRTHVIGRHNDKRTTHSTVWTEKGRLFILELLEDI